MPQQKLSQSADDYRPPKDVFEQSRAEIVRVMESRLCLSANEGDNWVDCYELGLADRRH